MASQKNERRLHDPPRQARLSQLAVTTRFLLVVLVGFALVLSDTSAIADLTDLKALLRDGRLVAAKVVAKSVHSGKTTTYSIDYAFHEGGVDIRDTESVSRSTYERLEPGDPYSITYLRANPSIYRTGVVDQDAVDNRQGLWAFWIVVGTLVVAAGWSVFEHELRTQRDLAVFGVETNAEVTSNEPYSQGTRSAARTIRYRFEASGLAGVGSFIVDQRSSARLQPGAKVRVLFDPSDVGRHRLIDRMSFVTFG